MSKTKLQLEQFSVFAIVSFLVYVITVITNGPSLGKRFILSTFVEGKIKDLPVPYLWVGITFFLTIVAMRLYLHAWAVDESPAHKKIRESLKGKFSFRLFGEWIFRIAWVLMVAYFPSVCSKGSIEVLDIVIKWQFYFLVLFCLIVIWDLLMLKYIIKFSYYVNNDPSAVEERIKQLKQLWLRYDFYLCVLALLNVLIWYSPFQGEWLNYKPPLFLLILSIMTVVCGIQIGVWGTEIYHNIKLSPSRTS